MAKRGGPRTPGPDKKIGRPAKPKIEQKADKSIATEVLAMDGPPDHERRCTCKVCEAHRERKCKCVKVHDQPLPAECVTFAEHRICHCELCRWWEHRLSPDKRIRYDADVYLTNKRDGKPAESVIAEGKMIIEVVERSGSADNTAAEASALSKIM
jgi:hypothetical protein